MKAQAFNREELESARDAAFILFTQAHLRLSAVLIGLDISEFSETDVRKGSMSYLEPVNLGAQVGWACYVGDKGFALAAVDELRQHVEGVFA